MKKYVWTLSTLAFLSLPLQLMAESLSWNAAIDEAARENLEIKVAQSNLRSFEYLEKKSKSGFLPEISATGNYTYDSTALPKIYSGSLTATENVFSGFSDLTKIDQAKANKESSRLSLDSIKSKISYDLKSAFVGLSYAQKLIKLTEDIIKRRESNLKLVQLKFESGRENIGSLNLAKAYLAEAKYSHLQAMNNLSVAKTQLGQLLGRSDAKNLSVSGSIPLRQVDYKVGSNLNFKNLIQDSPEIKKSLIDVELKKLSITLANSAFYPTLDLQQNVTRSVREGSSANNTWAISASINFPLFNGGKDYYTFKSLTEEYRSSVLAQKNTEDASVTKLELAYANYQEAQMKLEVDQAFVIAGNSRQRIAEAQYNNGLITFNDWDIIENDYIARQKSLLLTEKSRVIAEANWDLTQGKGDIP